MLSVVSGGDDDDDCADVVKICVMLFPETVEESETAVFVDNVCVISDVDTLCVVLGNDVIGTVELCVTADVVEPEIAVI